MRTAAAGAGSTSQPMGALLGALAWTGAAPDFTTVPWPFAKLAELWGGRGFNARTPKEFREALRSAWDDGAFALIDLVLEPGDISPILKGFVHAFKERVYRSP